MNPFVKPKAPPRRLSSLAPKVAERDVEGQLIYAIGDIHGRYDLLKDLLTKIAADSLTNAKGRKSVLVFCGDYVDRGPQSKKVVEALVWLNGRPEFVVHLLKGNHEHAMMNFLERPQEGRAWLRNGGATTLQAYGVEPPPSPSTDEDWIEARDRLLDRLPSSHLRLMERLELMVSIGDYVFVHAGIRPGVPLERQLEEDLLWIREEFILSGGPFEKIVVHGHTWFDAQPTIAPHRIGLDTGAYETGVLTAARLDGGEVVVLQTAGKTSRPKSEVSV